MIASQLRKIDISESAPVLSGEEIIANIRGMRPALQTRGQEIEELRRLPDDIVQMLRQAGAFRMMMPHHWGGPEMDPMQINDALEELALGNAAAAWCAMIQMDSGLYGGFLKEDVAHSMFGTLDSTASNVLRPSGRAQRVEGGYLVNGRWSFASGCQHADWFAGGCFVSDENGQPAQAPEGGPIYRIVLARREEFIIHDTWHTTGLRGTGSNDIEAKDLFVPAEQTFCFEDESRQSALYRWPAMLCAKMPGVALGIARSAIDTVADAMREKKETAAHVLLAIADAQTLYASARAYVHSSLEAVWARLTAGEAPTEQERVAVFLARTNAFQASRSAVQMMFEAAGAGAIYSKSSLLDRHLRDINTACHHVMAQRKGQQAAAALMIGVLDTPFSFL
jgi:alkylation response protein AidB-like acyl-CoA dehydrogenase